MEVLFILIIFLCFIRLDEIFVYGILIVEFRLLFKISIYMVFIRYWEMFDWLVVCIW